MTLALVEHKLRERGLLDRAELITVTPEHELALGGLRFHFIPVSHSIPQGYAPCGGYASGKSRAYGRLQDR